MSHRPIHTALLLGLIWSLPLPSVRAEPPARLTVHATASSTQPGSRPNGAVDGDRFGAGAEHTWQGVPGSNHWWWQAEFPQPRKVGAILQIQGDHPYVFTNAPAGYVWSTSMDGINWHTLEETRLKEDHRLFRLHRLEHNERCRFVRLEIQVVHGAFPVLREVEFLRDRHDRLDFPEWAVVVNTTHDPALPGEGQSFIPLAQSCDAALQAQQVWLGNFDKNFITAEPRPLCAFLSGNFKDWCEVDRSWWRGTETVLRGRNLPMWASCGGAQGLALLSEYGTSQPWDCPHCRDLRQPKTPIYGHIGHTASRPCGDYSACVFERGPFQVRQLQHDPVFAGLGREFTAMESHCGQIEWPPRGWDLVVTAGLGTKTKSQCLRLRGRYIYAAQFHIELPGAPENSRRIMSNFLNLARGWGGYNPHGRALPAVKEWRE